MKLNNHPYRTIVLLLLVLLAAACTREDDFATPTDNGTAIPAPLTITVTDGAYAPAPEPDGGHSPDTRAVERGYATEFTAGDKIGLYVLYVDSLNRRRLLRENLCVTYNGTEWTLDSGEKPLPPPQPNHHYNKNVYFAYYPYQLLEDPRSIIDQDATNSENVKTTEARFFFKPLIKDWRPAADQSTYEAYTASDLMVAGGEVAKHTDGTDGYELSFTMEHQMALMVFRVPTTKYTYTETIGGVETEEKSYRLYSGIDLPSGWKENNYTIRELWNPKLGHNNRYEGFYYNSSLEKCRFSVETASSHVPGKYRLFTIDGGEESVENRPLHEGDFYMKDGTIIPQENVIGNIPADVKKDCLGVVFWVGENEGRHWTQTGDMKGDHLLMRDHPGCVHGMVVALRDASAGDVWATGSGASEWLYEWAENFNGFTPGEQADWSAIQKSGVVGYGYCSSHLVKLYSAHNSDATFPAYNTISGYAARYPAPGSSSGWFLPDRGELAMMCYGMADNYPIKFDKTPWDYLNERFKMAGGDALEGKYWSASNSNNFVWYLNFSDGSYNYHPKSEAYKVRPVLAF